VLTLLLTALPHRLGEGVSHRGYPLPDHVCVHPQGHRRVGVPEASGDQVHGHPRANSVVAWTCRRHAAVLAEAASVSPAPSRRFVVPVDQLPHQ